jgi:ATP-dependent exoDNAse (exonuclease V) beta subunit
MNKATVMADQQAPDQAARNRIKLDLSSTLFVAAGAGSGKTTALIDRVLALVISGDCELEGIAAITFTEKAAAELRDKLRRGLEQLLNEPATPDDDRDRVRVALEQLDGAAIGTLHAFAQRILSEHPIEAGLPPRVEVIDEVSSDVAFSRRWTMFRDRLLGNPEYERTILLLVSANVRFDALRLIAKAFNDNWDLVDERVPDVWPIPPGVRELLAVVLEDIDRICDERCHDPGDSLRLFLDEIALYATELRAVTDELDLMEALNPDGPRKPPSFKPGNKGKQPAFDCDVKDLQDRIRGAGDQLEQVRFTVANACIKHLGSALREFTLISARERRSAGQLEFHDLLVLARGLLRDPVHGAAVRSRLHQRYRRLLLDEFQDTDPIQIELAVRIAAREPANGASGEEPWNAVAVEPGQLFFVGDPKQSIYRFRRADISMFLAASDRFGTLEDGAVELTANFRTVQPVIGWINEVFGRLIGEAAADGLGQTSQPPYVALEPVRPAPPVGPAVAVIGVAQHQPKAVADELRAAEAADVVATVSQVISEGWSVDDGEGGWRPATLGDITILVPARTSLPFLEDALDGLKIAYRAEASSLVYSSRAIRDLLMVVRAVADPTNQLHVVSALRTPLFACGDDDLFRFKSERRGSWSYLADQPDTVPADDPVRAGLTYLRSIYEQRHWLAPSELLDRIIRDRRAMELGFAEGRPRDVWRRLRFVTDQARAWSEATGGNLRQYLSWVELLTAEGARVAEAVLPETDDDAVRIMTIHSAKGLEFPITIVSGMSTVPQGRRAQADVVFPPEGPAGYRVGRAVKTDEYAEWAPIDEQMSLHERIRLLYVACTRARDHLVISLHRKERKAAATPERRTNAELLMAGMAGLELELPDIATLGVEVAAPALTPPAPLLPIDRWADLRDAALAQASRPTTVSATALSEEGEPDFEEEPLDEGLQKRPRDLDLPPWLKGRYGSAVGRAVHGVLQTIELGSGDGLDAAVTAQCEAEAIVDRTADVRQLVNFALTSSHVRNASTAQHWRELYVCVPVGDRLLEGYIDLLYRSTNGLVVVDYKTSSTSDAEELANRVGGYTTQGASYALAVSEAVGEPVVSVAFVFLTPDGPVEIPIDNLMQAVDAVRQRMTAPISKAATSA